MNIPKTKASLRVMIGNEVYLVNAGKEPVKVSRGTIVAEFYKGKWCEKPTDSKECALFELTDAQDVVKVGTQLESLNTLITSKQKINASGQPFQAKRRSWHSADKESTPQS